MCGGDCIKSDLERVGEEWEKLWIEELETVDRERSKSFSLRLFVV